ncbi:MAG TPA: hypothetical protein PLZ21_01200 [Armatimonadota bacterium]|nr:hypothetical protein [Armatimonadota bacterium]
MNLKRFILLLAGLIIAVFAAGCARSPEDATPTTGTRLIFTMTVAGQINPNYHYYVAIDTSGTTTPGPLPVVGPPWGNGWGTGNLTHYVVHDSSQPQGYLLYRISGPDLLFSNPVGPPISFIRPSPGSNYLQFTLDLGQLATDDMPAADIDLINVNFITTDIIPVDPNYPGPKYYDALGDRGNDFISFSVRTSQVYSNDLLQIEEPGDVPVNFSDLDIVDWSVEVQVR